MCDRQQRERWRRSEVAAATLTVLITLAAVAAITGGHLG